MAMVDSNDRTLTKSMESVDFDKRKRSRKDQVITNRT
jgi:hypothetical protein